MVNACYCGGNYAFGDYKIKLEYAGIPIVGGWILVFKDGTKLFVSDPKHKNVPETMSSVKTRRKFYERMDKEYGGDND